ncbi:MAG: LamG-like jellyroll fold domain-containing protein [Dehalococcoidia bacterium]|jgi:cell division protein FtsB
MKRIIFFLSIVALLCLAMQCNDDCTVCETQKAALQQQLNTCKAANTANQVKIAELTTQLQACSDENASNKTKIVLLTNELKECNDATEIYRAKIAELTQLLENCESADLAQQLEDCKTAKTALEQQIADLTQQLQACDATNTANQAKILELSQQLEDCIAQEAANNTKIAELTQQLQDCQASDALHQQNIAELTLMLDECNGEKIALNDSIKVLNDSIDALNSVGGTTRLWAYTYNLPHDSTVFNFWYSSEVAAPYQTKTSVGSLEFDQYTKIKGYERMYNKSSYTLNAGAAYLEIIIYDSTFTNVLFSGQYNIIEMLPKTEYKFEWNTEDFALPYLGKYYVSKVLYEKKIFKDRPLEGGYFTFELTNDLHTMLKMKTYPETTVKNIPNLKLYVNADTLWFPVILDKVDSTYVVYINKAFDEIDSLKFTADTNLILNNAFLSSMDLLNNPSIKVNGLTKVDNIYKILVDDPTPPNPLVARWRFENNGNDETGTYPVTVSSPVNMFKTSTPAEGTYLLSADGSGYTAVTPAFPFGDEFTICLWYRTWNQNEGMPVMGNSKVYYPDGVILYADGNTSKMFKFVTSDGTSGNRKYIMSVDGVLPVGAWVHVVITGSRTNAALGKMYINGVDKTRGSSTGVFPTFKSNLPLYLGKSSDSQGWCVIDDTRIYNRILTQEEIIKVYNKQNL